ncbi:phage tail assembly protein [Halobacteriovorax sp. GB3]|uniref:phage tail assembly protein n=1 Tax=Halobacteriovorax sp. GB3 TaxID=2719615 RepID=UPI00235E67D6|nr:phage tail assembly protein [Halobacteriovorax sp. GB3]MDD0852996.1 phage tail assembly protein [Halobacteriovorax sp. GB3]
MKTINLDEPIVHGSEQISVLSFPSMKAKHIMDMDLENIKMRAMIEIASEMCSIPPTILAELSIKDTGKVIDYVSKQLELLEIGEDSQDS